MMRRHTRWWWWPSSGKGRGRFPAAACGAAQAPRGIGLQPQEAQSLLSRQALVAAWAPTSTGAVSPSSAYACAQCNAAMWLWSPPALLLRLVSLAMLARSAASMAGARCFRMCVRIAATRGSMMWTKAKSCASASACCSWITYVCVCAFARINAAVVHAAITGTETKSCASVSAYQYTCACVLMHVQLCVCKKCGSMHAHKHAY